MAKNDKSHIRRETMSCGTLPWRVKDGKNQVLLIKQFSHRDRWGIPKGHVNEGEQPWACAIRETLEETGIKVQLLQPLPTVKVTNRAEHKTVLSWLARPHLPDLEPNINDPDSEVADARWFDLDDPPELVAYQRLLLQGAVDILRSAGDKAIEDLVAAPVR